MVHCIVLNSKFTHRGLSNNRFKLLKVTPVQIKPKLFRVIVNSWAWLVSLSICTLVIFSLLDYRGEEALTCGTVQGNKCIVKHFYHEPVARGIGRPPDTKLPLTLNKLSYPILSMMFKNGIYIYWKFVAGEHRKTRSPSPG